MPKHKIKPDAFINITKNIIDKETNAGQKGTELHFYKCLHCNYTTIYKSNFEKHNGTIKHVKTYFGNHLATHSTKYQCEVCNKIYQDRTGLWRHNKKCNSTANNNINQTNDIGTLTNLVLEVVKSNNEIQKQNNELRKNVMEIYKNGVLNTNIQNINSNNETFN